MREENKILLNEIREIIGEESKQFRMEIDVVKEQIGKIQTGLDEVKGQFSEVHAGVHGVIGQFSVIQSGLDELKEKVNRIELTLENETNRNIKLIAEGHLDLSRNLHDAMKVESEKELLLIRVNTLENEVSKLKAKIEQTA